jgi:hypothetical protein
METVQFAPKIATDLQIDWRRQSPGAGADMFTDLLADQMKRRADEAQQELDAQRRDSSRAWNQASDPVSGRPARVTVSTPKTIRGEAKQVDDTADRRLPDKSDSASDDIGAKVAKDPSAQDESAGDKTTDGKTKAEAEAMGDQPTPTTADAKQQTADPAAVVAVQATGQNPATVTPPAAAGLAVPSPVSPDGQQAAPTQGQPADAKNATTGENAAAADGTPTHPAIAPATDLSAALAALNTGEATPAPGMEAPVAVPQAAIPAIAQSAEKQPLLQMLQAPTPAADPAPPIQQQPGRPAIETKLRPGTPTRATADASDPAPGPAGAQPSAQAHVTTPVQPVAANDSASDGDGFDQPLAADGSTPGWALHLAQGAAGKRADFVAQLRQHLQNLPMQEQVAVHIQRALREGAGKLSIQLSPAELGRIHVKLDIDEDKRVTAAVTVERPSTLELLQRDVKGLERALHDAGLSMDAGDLSFSLGQSGDQEFAQDLGQSGAGGSGVQVSDVGSEHDQPDTQVAEVMDTAAGVVNLQV